MKKFLFLFTAILLLGVSCEKNVELSDYIVGKWKSQELVLGDSPFGTFTATINDNNTYSLSFTLSDGSASLTCPPTGYTIDEDKSQIIITQPDFDPNDGVTPTETQTFKVEWNKDSDIMTWIPDNSGGGDAPTLVWTRQ